MNKLLENKSWIKYILFLDDKPKQLIAIHSYKARFDSDLSFEKGDEFRVLEDIGSDWWKVFHIASRKNGMIPLKYVAKKNSLEAEEWVILKWNPAS